MEEQHKATVFERTVLPNLDAAYNLARWLTRNEHDAEDLVQEACLRAFRFIEGFHGGDSRAWLLAIVRNTCYTWLQQHRAQELTQPFAEETHQPSDNVLSQEQSLLRADDAERLRQALEQLPVEFREVVVLRELEGLSYKEIADLAKIPLGTVMSRLARARKQLLQHLSSRQGKESKGELSR